jgi:hypothetical protein
MTDHCQCCKCVEAKRRAVFTSGSAALGEVMRRLMTRRPGEAFAFETWETTAMAGLLMQIEKDLGVSR